MKISGPDSGLAPWRARALGLMVLASGPMQDHDQFREELVIGDSFGASVCLHPDVGTDKVPDVLVGVPDLVIGRGGIREYNLERQQAGEVWVLSGKDGAPIGRVEGKREGYGFGAAITVIGDLTGDGCPEFAVLAPNLNNEEGRDSAYVAVVDGRKLIIRRVVPIASRQGQVSDMLDYVPLRNGGEAGMVLFGLCDSREPRRGLGGVKAIPMANDASMRVLASGNENDGLFSDFAVLEQGMRGDPEVIITGYDARGTGGYVRIVSPCTGSVRFGFECGGAPEYGPLVVAGGPDVDADGVSDFAVACIEENAGEALRQVWLCSGKDGGLLQRYAAPVKEFGTGLAMAYGAESCGDPVLIVASYLAGPWYEGDIRAFIPGKSDPVWSVQGDEPSFALGFRVATLSDPAFGFVGVVCSALNVNRVRTRGSVRMMSVKDGETIWSMTRAEALRFLGG